MCAVCASAVSFNSIYTKIEVTLYEVEYIEY